MLTKRWDYNLKYHDFNLEEVCVPLILDESSYFFLLITHVQDIKTHLVPFPISIHVSCELLSTTNQSALSTKQIIHSYESSHKHDKMNINMHTWSNEETFKIYAFLAMYLCIPCTICKLVSSRLIRPTCDNLLFIFRTTHPVFKTPQFVRIATDYLVKSEYDKCIPPHVSVFSENSFLYLRVIYA